MKTQRFKFAFILGAITIAIMVWLGLSAPQVACGDAALPPVVAFQAARLPADISALFGIEASPCREGLIEGLKTGSEFDLYLFIPAYAAFLLALLWAFMPRGWPVLVTLVTVLIITVVGDILETATQLLMMENVNEASSRLGALALGNGMKTVGLSVFLAGLAWLLWALKTMPQRSLALALLTLAIIRTAGLMLDDVRPLAPLSALAAFAILWCYSGWRARASQSLPQ